MARAKNVEVVCGLINPKPLGLSSFTVKDDEERYCLEIRIQGDLPKAMNKVMNSHWRKNGSDTKRWQKLIGQPAMLFRPEKLLTNFKISAIRYNYRTLDYDGLVASLKPCIDALKGIVIEDDRWSMTGQWDVRQEFRSKKEGPSLKIVITAG